MKEFTLKKYSFGDYLGIVGDTAHPPLAEKLGRLDVDGDMPRLAEAVGLMEGEIVVDAGAFIGDTAMALAKGGAVVHAFEPFLDAYTCLLYNTRGLRVNPINRPTGNGERVKLVHECPGPNFGMRSVVPCNDADTIETFRIDDLGLEQCQLMKIDVEGSEIPTLMGAVKTIDQCRPFLYVEMYAEGLTRRGYTPEQLKETIESLGYKLEMWGEPPRFDWFCTPL